MTLTCLKTLPKKKGSKSDENQFLSLEICRTEEFVGTLIPSNTLYVIPMAARTFSLVFRQRRQQNTLIAIDIYGF